MSEPSAANRPRRLLGRPTTVGPVPGTLTHSKPSATWPVAAQSRPLIIDLANFTNENSVVLLHDFDAIFSCSQTLQICQSI